MATLTPEDITSYNEKIQKLSEETQTLQLEIQKSKTAQAKLEIQLHENKIVEEEFSFLAPDAGVFKLVGPVLVRQDLELARETVRKRLEYITSEFKRHEKACEDTEKEFVKCRQTSIALQQEYQKHTSKGKQGPEN